MSRRTEPGHERTTEPRPARILVVSVRRVNYHAAWGAHFEFEDVLREVDEIDLLELEQGRFSKLRGKACRSLAYRGLTTGLSPGVQTVTLERDYDALLFVAMNVWDLLYLNAVKGWQRRCRVKLCFMAEFYAGSEAELVPLIRLLRPFDVVGHAFAGNVELLGRLAGTECVHVPLAVDVRRFSPHPAHPVRVVDVLSVGRRSEPVHRELLQWARRTGAFYIHDTLPSACITPRDHVEHREQFACLGQRSRLFVAYPAKHGDGESRNLSEVGSRFFEASAAGAVLVGRAPSASSYAKSFPWPDAVFALPDQGAAEVVQELLARPADLERLGRRNAVHALRHHDWAHRWRQLLQLARLPEHPALEERIQALSEMADAAEAGAERGHGCFRPSREIKGER